MTESKTSLENDVTVDDRLQVICFCDTLAAIAATSDGNVCKRPERLCGLLFLALLIRG